MSAEAPFRADLAEGPERAHARWVRTSDGVRIRVAYWVPDGATSTVVVLPGRTEPVEKYGRTAAELARRGHATLAIDWRGQGRSDRALRDPMTGHVAHFDEYQRDLDAALSDARTVGLPEPAFLIGHSMGGAIGLRALKRGLPFRAAAFSAPMWGISLSRTLRPVAVTLAALARIGRQGHRYVPGYTAASYVATAPFADNLLTTDPDMFAYMQRQLVAEPALALGGPSLGWLHAALTECRSLAALPSPAVPALAMIGPRERIVDLPSIYARMARWPNGRLIEAPGAQHEVIMEAPPIRDAFFDAATTLFRATP